MCRSCSTCCMPHPPVTQFQVADIIHTHAPTAPINTLPVDTTALLETQHAKVVGKRVTGKQNAEALVQLVCKCPIINPSSKVMKRGENHKLPKPKQRKDPHTKTCSLLQWTCRTVGDMHPKEMLINNMSSQKCNEVYTVIKLPASASSKGSTSVHVKIDTGSGGNILTSLSVQTAASKTNNPRWPAYWSGPHTNQANHLQWVSDSSV